MGALFRTNKQTKKNGFILLLLFEMNANSMWKNIHSIPSKNKQCEWIRLINQNNDDHATKKMFVCLFFLLS